MPKSDVLFLMVTESVAAFILKVWN